MNGWDIACVTCSAGWVMCISGLFAYDLVYKYRPKLAIGFLIFGILGASSCAAERRVCEIAERVNDTHDINQEEESKSKTDSKCFLRL